MRYRYYTCDVFTARRFGGNPLAVLPEAVGLSAEDMQRIAREFNYSESTFVLPAASGGHARMRPVLPMFTQSDTAPMAQKLVLLVTAPMTTAAANTAPSTSRWMVNCIPLV